MQKRFFSLILVFLLILPLVFLLSACGKKTVDPEIVGDVLTDEEYEILRNTDYYNYLDEEAEGFTLTDQPIMRWHSLFLDPSYFLDGNTESAEGVDLDFGYYVIGKNPVRMSISTKDQVKVVNVSSADSRMISDIVASKKEMKICGVKCHVNHISLQLSYIGTHYMENILYYDTDKGMYVRYYHDFDEPGVWFAGEEFRDYWAQFQQDKYEQTHDDEGNPRFVTGPFLFLEFVERLQEGTFH